MIRKRELDKRRRRTFKKNCMHLNNLQRVFFGKLVPSRAYSERLLRALTIINFFENSWTFTILYLLQPPLYSSVARVIERIVTKIERRYLI